MNYFSNITTYGPDTHQKNLKITRKRKNKANDRIKVKTTVAGKMNNYAALKKSKESKILTTEPVIVDNKIDEDSPTHVTNEVIKNVVSDYRKQVANKIAAPIHKKRYATNLLPLSEDVNQTVYISKKDAFKYRNAVHNDPTNMRNKIYPIGKENIPCDYCVGKISASLSTETNGGENYIIYTHCFQTDNFSSDRARNNVQFGLRGKGGFPAAIPPTGISVYDFISDYDMSHANTVTIKAQTSDTIKYNSASGCYRCVRYDIILTLEGNEFSQGQCTGTIQLLPFGGSAVVDSVETDENISMANMMINNFSRNFILRPEEGKNRVHFFVHPQELPEIKTFYPVCRDDAVVDTETGDLNLDRYVGKCYKGWINTDPADGAALIEAGFTSYYNIGVICQGTPELNIKIDIYARFEIASQTLEKTYYSPNCRDTDLNVSNVYTETDALYCC
jgi:hypothetical protein